jgi:hypothetical protein
MLNDDDLFLVSIFRRAYPFDLKPSAEEFLHHSSFEIYRTCRVMKLLGLVEDAPSTLGFKPSDLLIDIVAGKRTDRPYREKASQSPGFYLRPLARPCLCHGGCLVDHD